MNTPEEQLQAVEHLVRNWVNEQPDHWGQWGTTEMREMVEYVLREEETEKRKAMQTNDDLRSIWTRHLKIDDEFEDKQDLITQLEALYQEKLDI